VLDIFLCGQLKIALKELGQSAEDDSVFRMVEEVRVFPVSAATTCGTQVTRVTMCRAVPCSLFKGTFACV